MREIKFRAFDKRKNTMLYSNIVWGNSEIDCPVLTGLNYGDDIENLSELMECTGLFDKKGKEIYRGDIVIIESEHTNVITEDGNGPKQTQNQLVEVVFEKGCYGVRLKRDDYFYERFYSFAEIEDLTGQDEFEVIGSIYENSELLK